MKVGNSNSYLNLLECIRKEERQNLFFGALESKMDINVNIYIELNFGLINFRYMLLREVIRFLFVIVGVKEYLNLGWIE